MMHISPSELKITFVRAPGPGGQNVNKLATAAVLRFNIADSASLSEPLRERLLTVLGNKITKEGDIIIKASRFRTQERNKQDAILRLQALLKRAAFIPKKRKKSKPTAASKERRLEKKKLHSKTKKLRSRYDLE